MKIELIDLTIRNQVARYHDDGGALDIRPPFQREFMLTFLTGKPTIKRLGQRAAAGAFDVQCLRDPL